jgi:hypothetical protein
MMLRRLAVGFVVAGCLAGPAAPVHASPPSPPSGSSVTPRDVTPVTVAPAATAAPGELSAPAVAECVAIHDSAGLLRREDRWLEARAAMQRCGDDACPIAIRTDCRTWLDEIVLILPTLLVVVERDDDGKRPVKLELDGQSIELPEKLGPIEVLPGAHRLRFTLEGYPPVETEVTLQKGEKNHVVRARFLRPQVAAPAPPTVRSPARPTRPAPLATFLYAGGSVLSFAMAAVLLGTALDARANARDTCAPGCPESRRDSIDRRLLLADVAGLVGAGLGGMAVYTFVRRPQVTTTSQAPALRVAVAAGHAELVVGGSF